VSRPSYEKKTTWWKKGRGSRNARGAPNTNTVPSAKEIVGGGEKGFSKRFLGKRKSCKGRDDRK